MYLENQRDLDDCLGLTSLDKSFGELLYEKALQTLRKDEREVIEVFFGLIGPKLGYVATGEKLGRSKNTVQTTVKNSLEKMRDLMRVSIPLGEERFRKAIAEQNDDLPVQLLGLSNLTLNKLKRLGRHTLGDLERIITPDFYINYDMGAGTAREILRKIWEIPSLKNPKLTFSQLLPIFRGVPIADEFPNIEIKDFGGRTTMNQLLVLSLPELYEVMTYLEPDALLVVDWFEIRNITMRPIGKQW